MRLTKQISLWILVVLLLCGSWGLYRATPVGYRSSSWVHCVLRNWQDFGFLNLKGKLVYNSGGGGLPEHPLIYGGHRPGCLYPAYFVGRMTGDGGGGLAFHLIVSLTIGVAIWCLLGCSIAGAVVAILVVFSPAYLRLVTGLDPFGLPVLLGIPFMCRARELLGREKMTVGTVAILGGLILACASLNWTTIVAFGITVVYLTVAFPTKQLKRVSWFAVAVGSVGAVVLAISLASKAGNGAAAASGKHLTAFYNQYLLGSPGYDGNGMNWTKAMLRLLVANVVGLLPLGLLFGWDWWRSIRRAHKVSWQIVLPILPLLAAMIFISGLRNYFAHHPWMAGPVLIYGMVFSIKLIWERLAAIPNEASGSGDVLARSPLIAGGVVLVGFAYGWVVLSLLQVNSANMDALQRLARKNTARQAVIYYLPETDPWIAQNATRLAEMMDRTLLPLSSSKTSSGETSPALGQGFRLTSQASRTDESWLARTESKLSLPQQLIMSILDWYGTHISKRAKGDQIKTEGDMYLYKLP